MVDLGFPLGRGANVQFKLVVGGTPAQIQQCNTRGGGGGGTTTVMYQADHLITGISLPDTWTVEVTDHGIQQILLNVCHIRSGPCTSLLTSCC